MSGVSSVPPPIYKKWTQFTRTCSCGRRKAVHERRKEEQVNAYIASGMTLKDANIRWLKENNQTRLCCLRDYTYPEKNQIYDDTIGAMTDITVNKMNHLKENYRNGDNSGYPGYEFLFKTRGKVDFNMAQHSYRMFLETLSTFDKMEVLRRDGTSSVNNGSRSIPQFPNYYVTKSENMPTIISDTPLLPVASLNLRNLMSETENSY